MPPLLILHLMDGVEADAGGPVSRAAGEKAMAWCQYLEAQARRISATVTDSVSVAAALVATKLARHRLPSPFTAREVSRHEGAGLTEPRLVPGALERLDERGWIRSETVRGPDGGRPSVRFHINPRRPVRRE